MSTQTKCPKFRTRMPRIPVVYLVYKLPIAYPGKIDAVACPGAT